VVQLLKALVDGAKTKGVDLGEEHSEIVQKLVSAEPLFEEFKGTYPQLVALWEDAGIKQMAENHAGELSLELVDTASYWIANYKRILADDYLPSVEDLIKCRRKPLELLISVSRWTASNSSLLMSEVNVVKGKSGLVVSRT